MEKQTQAVIVALTGNPHKLTIVRSMNHTAELREEIGRGLDDMAIATRMVKLIASRGITPWTIRQIKEIEATHPHDDHDTAA